MAYISISLLMLSIFLIASLIYLVLRVSAALVSASKTEKCDHIQCSYVKDNVCGMAVSLDSNVVVSKYLNLCHLEKINCQFGNTVEIKQVSANLCHIEKTELLVNSNGRRVNDFSIVGAHQACNHTCPTYCVDTYEPACAQIWRKGMKKFNYKPMINHCHIDLFSCVVGVNVTIQPLAKCYHNPSGLLFMSQVAGMKSLGLLDDFSIENQPQKEAATSHRRSNDRISSQVKRKLKRLILRDK